MGNNRPYMSKSLRKAIMTRSKLKDRLNKLSTPEKTGKSYKIQRNICVELHTVSHRLRALGAYLKTEVSGWALIRTRRLFRTGRLLKK